jgi:CheY-like chemotaxis protein
LFAGFAVHRTFVDCAGRGDFCRYFFKNMGASPYLMQSIMERLMLCFFLMSGRLLVHVDDDKDWAFLIDRALAKSGLTSWQYQHLAGGRAGLDYLTRVKIGQARRPDLLALDIRMPEIDGLEILEWVSANLPDIPAVMLSSSELLSDRLEARNLGSKGYFSKESVFTDFLEFLRQWDETALARRRDDTVLAPAEFRGQSLQSSA